MRLRKLGHSCLLVESGDTRVLLDPGAWSPAADGVDGVAAVLITHQHPDHVDADRLQRVLERNPDAQVVADSGTATMLRDEHGLDVTVAEAGTTFAVGDITIEPVGELHAEILPEIPRIPNVGYLLDGRLLHPGDALSVTDRDVEILALPAMAPWMRMADALDFLRAVAPRVAVPIHDGLLQSRDIYYGTFATRGPEGTEFRVIDDGEPVTV